MPLSRLVCIFLVDPSHRINLSFSPKPKLSHSASQIHTLPQTGPEMGVFKVLRLLCLLWLSLFFLLMMGPYSIRASGEYRAQGGSDVASSGSDSQPPQPPVSDQRSKVSPFRPSIAVIVGVLTTMFSVTFLLLLYAKHCKTGNGYANGTPRGLTPSTARKNSGIDRTVIESLPVFRFGSLRGRKDGLECAVCLNRFEPSEVLRLLPKCKHAFHVECVDTWLDAHSTCPLCRYRVDPEDILLIEDNKVLHENDHPPPPPAAARAPPPPPPPPPPPLQEEKEMTIRRVSGRHSWAGERRSGFLEIIVERQGESETHDDPMRRSLDSWRPKKKHNNEAVVSVGCFDRPRKDGLLLSEGSMADRTSFERRFEHRIIISGGGSEGGGSGSSGGSGSQFNHRWSDLQPSDLLYLRSEMIIGDSRRLSGSRPSVSSSSRGQRKSGRSVINVRSVSEITGLSRFSSSSRRGSNEQQQKQRQAQAQAGVASRWLAWISQSQSEPAVRSGRRSTVVV